MVIDVFVEIRLVEGVVATEGHSSADGLSGVSF